MTQQFYPIMTKSFVKENCACQKGKGTDYARNLLESQLKEFYDRYGVHGYVLQCDIKHFYQSIEHSVADGLFKSKLPEPVYKRASRVLNDQYEGDVGYNPGSQMVQILGISILDEMDHYIKEKLGIEFYIRYMDDFILLHPNEEYLRYCKGRIAEYLGEIKLTLHPKKTEIYKIGRGIKFLGFTFRLVKSGVVVKSVAPKNVKSARKRMLRMANLVKKGERTRAKADECYRAWRAHAEKGTSHDLLRRMDAYYESLWRETT